MDMEFYAHFILLTSINDVKCFKAKKKIKHKNCQI